MRHIKIIGFLLVIIAIYAYTWVESSQKSERLFADAQMLYDQDDFIAAIKGAERVVDGNYVFLGGVQQVIFAWEGPLSWPKPAIYHTARELLDTIIDQKLDVEQGLQIFERYFQLDRTYLDRILLRVGDLYFDQKKYDRATEVYQMAKAIFVTDQEIQTYATQRLIDLENVAKEISQ